MKLKAFLFVAVVAMLVAIAPAKQPNPGTLGPPENFMVTQNATSFFFSWDPVEGATKYSVPVCGEITYGDGTTRGTVKFHVDLSTDGNVGTTYMRSGKVVLEVPKRLVFRKVMAAIQLDGTDPTTVIGFLLEGTAKVKALNPGKGRGPQNNPFSEPATFSWKWVAPA